MRFAASPPKKYVGRACAPFQCWAVYFAAVPVVVIRGILDEVLVKIIGEQIYLWRAVDQEDDVLDTLFDF